MRSPALLCALVLANHVGTALLISSDVFLRFAGRNCFERHGATDLESPTGSSAGTMALDACEALCDSTSGCTSIVYGGAEGDCFRRANVSLGSCAVEGGGYDLYTKEFEPLACDALPDSKMLPGFDGAADDAAARVAWRAALDATRDACQVDFNASIFELDASAWTQTSYIQPQMHPMDRFFYEPGVGYTPQRWLDDVNARYGGVDSILLWPTYPNIGADNRNQFDVRSRPLRRPRHTSTMRIFVVAAAAAARRMFTRHTSNFICLLAVRRHRHHPRARDSCSRRTPELSPAPQSSASSSSFSAPPPRQMFTSMPGGLAPLAAAIAELEAAGVRVLLPYNPWDTSTNRSDVDDARALGRLRAQLRADGFNGDTMDFVDEEFDSVDLGVKLAPWGGARATVMSLAQRQRRPIVRRPILATRVTANHGQS